MSGQITWSVFTKPWKMPIPELGAYVRSLGFDGKFLIHPSQIRPVNRIFRPTDEELARARNIVAAFEAAEARGLGVTSIDGKMIDTPIASQARRLLSLAAAIENSERDR